MRYRTLDVRIWCDEKFRTLSGMRPSGQGLFLYLLTNPNTTAIPGLYRAGAAAMAEELGWPLEEFQKIFDEILRQGLVKADFKARVIFIPNALKYNKPQSPNVVKSWGSHWDEIPECGLKTLAYQAIKDFLEGLGEVYAKAFQEATLKSLGKTMLNQEQEQEQEQEKKKGEVKTSPRLLSEAKIADTDSSDVMEVFKYWQEVMNHPHAKFDKKRADLINRSLALGYSVEDLKLAIDGCTKTPFNMGGNDRNQVYDGINLIFRDADHIDRFIHNATNLPSLKQPDEEFFDDVMAGVE